MDMENTVLFSPINSNCGVTSKRPKVLALFYVNVSSEKGDSIRVRESIRCMRDLLDVELICIHSRSFPKKIQCTGITSFSRGMAFVWNTLSLIYGLFTCIGFKPDIIYADACPGSVSPVLLSILTQRPLIIEMHTPAGVQDVTIYRARSRFRVLVARYIEKITLSRAKLIIASQGWAKLLQDLYGIPEERVFVTSLAVNRDLFRPMDLHECRRKLNLPMSAPIAIFVGNMGPWQGLDTLIKAAPLIVTEFPNAIFLMVGEGASRMDLVQQARDLGMDGAFRFIGSVPYEHVPTYIGASDVGLALFPGNRGRKGGVSAHKTLNYLACGRPMVVSEMDELAAYVEDRGAGKRVQSDDVRQLAEGLLQIFRRTDGGQVLKDVAAQLGAGLPSWSERIISIVDHIGKVLRSVTE